ncbi:butyrophilin-like protein 10 isoform X2 [Erpetoichthys calabaricus]|uniref:butyrophilin-like protein 10 isoform X2 n=1 Tax=Erpetoichthys calabaricus TaxID=27687 RepID=UPI002234DC40|nr:butyrophilin-like protein 10 isoform X2 [Erpetoichthys calabaricus]
MSHTETSFIWFSLKIPTGVYFRYETVTYRCLGHGDTPKTRIADMLFQLLEVFFIFNSELSEGSISDDSTITASPGEDVLLSCFFKPQTELVDSYLAVRWLCDFSVVHYTIDGEDLSDLTSHQFRGRTRIFPSQLSVGNASLLLQDVTVDDTGNYTCNVIGNTLRSTQSIQLDIQESFLPSIVGTPCVFFAIICVCLFIFKHFRKKNIKESLRCLFEQRPASDSSPPREEKKQKTL